MTAKQQAYFSKDFVLTWNLVSVYRYVDVSIFLFIHLKKINFIILIIE